MVIKIKLLPSWSYRLLGSGEQAVSCKTHPVPAVTSLTELRGIDPIATNVTETEFKEDNLEKNG